MASPLLVQSPTFCPSQINFMKEEGYNFYEKSSHLDSKQKNQIFSYLYNAAHVSNKKKKICIKKKTKNKTRNVHF
jgi:hypothetical protein